MAKSLAGAPRIGFKDGGIRLRRYALFCYKSIYNLCRSDEIKIIRFACIVTNPLIKNQMARSEPWKQLAFLIKRQVS